MRSWEEREAMPQRRSERTGVELQLHPERPHFARGRCFRSSPQRAQSRGREQKARCERAERNHGNSHSRIPPLTLASPACHSLPASALRSAGR